MSHDNKIKKIFGIDTMYFFYQTSNLYDNLFVEIIDQLDFQEARYKQSNVDYTNKDMFVNINNSTLLYNGKAEGGFYWFSCSNGYFRIGFKKSDINLGLHNIYVQLQSIGIYTLGVKALLLYLDDLLTGYVLNDKQISRVDYNCFVQYDFSFIDKTMFASRKQKYSSYGEIGDSKNTQTFYVGKKPFMLRIYNKKLELKNKKNTSDLKRALMLEHFTNNGFDLENPIFNLEFEMHRSYLKSFKILTVEQALENANNMFKSSMDLIRLLDLNSISQSDIKNNNKSRVKSLDIWEEIKNEYDYKPVPQNQLSLEKIQRAINTYDYNKFEIEYRGFIRKALRNNLYLDLTYITHLFDDVMENLYGEKYKEEKRLNKGRLEIDFELNDGKTDKFIQRKNGDVIKGIVAVNVKKLNDKDLDKYYSLLHKTKHLSNKNAHLFKIAENEMKERKLIYIVEKPEINFVDDKFQNIKKDKRYEFSI